MNKTLKMAAVIVLAGGLSGCYTTGLSTRETAGFNYSNFIYGLYDTQPSSGRSKEKVQVPMRLAIAQVGEAAPVNTIKEKLMSEPQLIASVVAIPGGGMGSDNPYNYQYDRENNGSQKAQEQIKKMLNLAKDLDTDYLYLMGGTADISQRQGWLGVMDFSIIGMFMIPTQQIVVDGKASGALIDVHTGKVLFIVSSQGNVQRKTTTVAVDGKKDETLLELRSQLLSQLTEEFIAQLRSNRP